MAVYQNFRAGNLKQGQALGMISTDINLNVDNTSVAPSYYNPSQSMAGMLNVFSTGTNANDATQRNLTINPVNIVGFELFIIFSSSVPQPNPPTPPVTGTATATVRFTTYGLAYSWIPTHEGDYMVLMSNGTDWTLINNVIGGAAIGGGLSYQGTWDANTNTPTLVDPPLPATAGFYYLVSVGATRFGTVWNVGDWAVSNGAAWQKVDNTDLVVSVFGRTGAVVAASGDYNASEITNTPSGGISAITVQSAIEELDLEKLGNGLTDAHIFVGDGTNTAVDVAVGGQLTMDNTGNFQAAAKTFTIAQLADTVINETSGTLSQAQLLDLFNTPVTVIPAPDPGYYIVIDECEIFHSYSTAAYALGGILQMEYSSGADIMSFPVTLVTDAANATYVSKPVVYDGSTSAGTGSLNITALIGLGVRISNLVALFINGNSDNVIKYKIRWHLVQAQT